LNFRQKRREKIADLKHNLDVSRRKTPAFHKDETYRQALVFLENRSFRNNAARATNLY